MWRSRVSRSGVIWYGHPVQVWNLERILQMPRFFFDVDDGHEHRDEVGRELKEGAPLRAQALAVATRLLAAEVIQRLQGEERGGERRGEPEAYILSFGDCSSGRRGGGGRAQCARRRGPQRGDDRHVGVLHRLP